MPLQEMFFLLFVAYHVSISESKCLHHCRCPLDKALRLSERSYLGLFFFLFFLNTLYFHSRCGYVGSRLYYTEQSDRN